MHTCYAPVRHSHILLLKYLPFDLHVLGLPLAFILSQDQTLHCNYSYNFLRSYFICQLPLASSPTDYNKCSTLRSINYYHSLTRIFCELLHIEVPRKVRYQVSFIQRTYLSAVANQLGIISIDIEKTPKAPVSARFSPLLLKGDAKVSFWVYQRKYGLKIFRPRSAACTRFACGQDPLKPT